MEVNNKIIRFFSCLADETRLSILLSLKEKDRSVNEIHNCLGVDKLTLSAVSHQLKQLTDLDMVVFEKRGREKIFKLSENFCWCLLDSAIKHFGEGSSNCKACCKIRK